MANAEKEREYKRAWAVANAEKERGRKRAWAAANAEKVRERLRAWHKANAEKARERLRAWCKAHPEAVMLRDARNRAKAAGVPCTLTPVDVCALLAPMRCSATGLPLVRSVDAPGALSPTLDRIEPARGYVPGNVRLVCHRFNTLRRTDPVSQDFRHALRVLAETTHADDSAITRSP